MGFFSKKLGIDLGTANTLVFAPEQGVVLNEPSVVAVSQVDHTVLAVGNEAKVMIGRTPEDIVAYCPMRDGAIADYRVTEAMLRYFISKALGRFQILKPEVMVSVPAGVTSTERRSVIEAAVKAGAKAAYVVKEPILAAIGAGIPIYEPSGHMVVDIGGGTTDIAVISLGGIVAATSVKVAGNKVDQAIADYIKRHLNLAIGDRTAEEIKIEIGSATPVEEEHSYEIRGRDILTGLPRSAEISTNEIVDAISDRLQDMVRAVKLVLQETPPELAADIIDKGIIMTGGGSLLQNIDELIYRSTGVTAHIAKDEIPSKPQRIIQHPLEENKLYILEGSNLSIWDRAEERLEPVLGTVAGLLVKAETLLILDNQSGFLFETTLTGRAPLQLSFAELKNIENVRIIESNGEYILYNDSAIWLLSPESTEPELLSQHGELPNVSVTGGYVLWWNGTEAWIHWTLPESDMPHYQEERTEKIFESAAAISSLYPYPRSDYFVVTHGNEVSVVELDGRGGMRNSAPFYKGKAPQTFVPTRDRTAYILDDGVFLKAELE